MSSIIPAILVAQQDGTIRSQNVPAQRLLGRKEGRFCWEVVGGLKNAENLPCRNNCVRDIIDSGINRSVHSTVKINGQRHRLSCVPVDKTVVCMLNPANDETPQSWQQLTPRECEVLELLAEGETNTAIATTLGLSESTIRTHVEKMFTRLSVNNRAALVSQGFRLGYLY
jgi:DNA-binding CsgD family transcriptional regulator